MPHTQSLFPNAEQIQKENSEKGKVHPIKETHPWNNMNVLDVDK